MSYELKIGAKDRFAGRFIGAVRKALMRAAMAEKKVSGLSQQSIASKLGINRSVINRILKGEFNLTLRSVAEIAWALGWEIEFSLRKPTTGAGTRSGLVTSVASAALQAQPHGTLVEAPPMIHGAVITSATSPTVNDNYAPIGVAA